MRNMQDKEKPIDPKLLEKIELLRSTPERDDELAAKGRERFLAEIDNLPVEESKSFLARLGIPLFFGSRSPNDSRTRKLAFSTLAVVIVALVVLFGGFSATAYASQTALPGDALFTIKTGIESTQVSLARDAFARAQLQMRFAQRRLDDITILLEQGRLKDVELASSEFETYIQNALDSLAIVMAGDPERGAELSNLISGTLLDYALALKNVLVNVPEAVKPTVEKALLLSQDSAGDEIEILGLVETITETELHIEGQLYVISEITEFEDLIEAGDLIKVHVIVTSDGANIVREIELVSAFDDQDNGHEVDSDENANESDEEANENEDNSNGNENEDIGNDNADEDDGDENSNEAGGDDNANEDDSENSNEDDDDANKNEDDGDNKNDNSGDGGRNDNDDKNHNDNDNDNSNDNDSNEEEDNTNEIDD